MTYEFCLFSSLLISFKFQVYFSLLITLDYELKIGFVDYLRYIKQKTKVGIQKAKFISHKTQESKDKIHIKAEFMCRFSLPKNAPHEVWH